MTKPTRSQIEAVYAFPTYKVEILIPLSGYTTITNAYVASISGNIDSSGSDSNAVAFGTPNDPNATLEVENYSIAGHYLSERYWIGKLVRISYGFSTNFSVVFTGPITSIRVTDELVQYELGGTQTYLRDSLKLNTPIYYRRPVATATTNTSVEDPTAVNYAAGLLNYAFWQAGGRPYQQKGISYTESDSGFRFWYVCDQSLMIPEYSWFSENSLEEIYAFCRAVGGQLYQDAEGVLHYAQPLEFANTVGYSDYYTFTDSVFQGYREEINTIEETGTLKATYTPRRVQPTQQVIEDKTPRFFTPGETKVIELAPQLPIWEYVNINASALIAQLIDGRDVTPTIGTIEQYASKLIITITNPSDIPMFLYSITIEGRPLAAGDEVSMSYGTLPPERTLENNVNVQNEEHARRLTKLVYDFYSALKPIITLNDVQFDTDRYIGELVKLNSRFKNDPYALYRIIRIAYNGSGTSMDIGLIDVSELPTKNDMFIIGNTYASNTIKQLSY